MEKDEKNVSKIDDFISDVIKDDKHTHTYCGMEFREDGKVFLCGQLWIAGQRKYCPRCRRKNDSQ